MERKMLNFTSLTLEARMALRADSGGLSRLRRRTISVRMGVRPSEILTGLYPLIWEGFGDGEVNPWD